MKNLTVYLTTLVTMSAFSAAELTVFTDRASWENAVGQITTAAISTQSFDGTDSEDTEIPVATDTFNIFGNFSVYLETLGNVNDSFFDYAFDSSTNMPLDLGIDITGSDTTTALEFRFAEPQVGFAADFFSVDVGEGLSVTLFNGGTPTGEVVNLDAILTPTGGDGFLGFTTDLPFTSFAFSPLSTTAMLFNLDEVSTAAFGAAPVISAPLIVSTSFDDGTFAFALDSSEIGRTYQIQSNTNASLDTWADVGDVFSGTGAPMRFEVVTSPTEVKRFFRIKVDLPEN